MFQKKLYILLMFEYWKVRFVDKDLIGYRFLKKGE